MDEPQSTKRLLASHAPPLRGRPRHVLIWDLLSLGIPLPMLGAAEGDRSRGARKGYTARSWVHRLATGRRFTKSLPLR